MGFRFYTNVLSQASRTVAAGIFIVGLTLIGFGFMICLLPKLFATLAAIVFFLAGGGCAVTAVRIFLAQKKLDATDSQDGAVYRKNVQVRRDEDYY